MSQAWIIKWEPSEGNLEKIASIQTLTAAGNLVLNINNPPNANVFPNNPETYPFNESPNGFYTYDQVARTVSLTSVDDNSTVLFTIRGYGSAVDADGNPVGLLNQLVIETIFGPSGGTVYSDYIYTTIESIRALAPATNISAGFGSSGITNFIFPDYDRRGWYASCSAQVINPGGLTYSGFLSLNKPSYPGPQGILIPFVGGEIPAFPIATAMTGAANNQIAQLNYPIATIWFRISANTPDHVGESAVFTVLQQGIS
jgi:hypothetical protein